MSDIYNLYRESGRPLGEDLRTNAPYWAATEIAALRKKLEQAEARCAELESENESLWEAFVKVSDYLGIDDEAARKIPGKPSSVFRSAILRKQAEAVGVLAKRLQEAADKADEGPDESDTACTLIIAKSVALKEVQRLRQQATELESGDNNAPRPQSMDQGRTAGRDRLHSPWNDRS